LGILDVVALIEGLLNKRLIAGLGRSGGWKTHWVRS